MKYYYVYIAMNKNDTVLYVGVTDDLTRRYHEHKDKSTLGFTKRYNICKIVYFEETSDVKVALEREKQLKRWHRDWKINLILSKNPGLQNLVEDPETSSG